MLPGKVKHRWILFSYIAVKTTRVLSFLRFYSEIVNAHSYIAVKKASIFVREDTASDFCSSCLDLHPLPVA